MSMIEELQNVIKDAPKNSIIFFGGAGVSTESGIPDFRSPDGLYNQKYDYPPEIMLSHSFFMQRPAEFYKFYFDRVFTTDKQPNQAHKKLAELEQTGQLLGVITQNIDGLHQAAGSKKVYELHGSIHRNYCMECGTFYDGEKTVAIYQEAVKGSKDPSKWVPRCHACGGLIKPDVVLYEEPLDQQIMCDSASLISQANIMIIAGTSLVVNPAASLVQYFHGDTLAVVNLEPTLQDAQADILIHDKVGAVFDF